MTFGVDDIMPDIEERFPALNQKLLKKLIVYTIKRMVTILRRYDVIVKIYKKQTPIHKEVGPDVQEKMAYRARYNEKLHEKRYNKLCK